MTSTTVFLRTLQEIARFASTDMTRRYITGVYVESHDGFAFVVATDGSALCARRVDHEDITPMEGVIIPTDVLMQWKFKPKDPDLRATLTKQDDGNCILSDGSAARIFKPIEAHYPAWRRVTPETVNGVMSRFDWAYMDRFTKLGKALGLGTPRLMPNDLDPALVSFDKHPDIYGVLMPMRGDGEIAKSSPLWAREDALKIAA